MHRMLEVEREVQAEIVKERATELQAMTQLYLAVCEMLTTETWVVGKRGNSREATVLMMGLLTKSFKTFRSLQILCAYGYTEDAKVLLRVLVETYIAVKFILQKRRTERARIFRAWAMAQDLKMMRESKTTKGLKRGIPKKLIKRYEQALISLTKSLPPTVRFDRQGSGLRTIYETFQAVHGRKLYNSFYRMTSAFVHGSDIGAHQEIEEGDPVNQFLPRLDGFDATALPAREVFWNTAHEIDRKIGLGFEAKLAPHKLTRASVNARKAVSKGRQPGVRRPVTGSHAP